MLTQPSQHLGGLNLYPSLWHYHAGLGLRLQSEAALSA